MAQSPKKPDEEQFSFKFLGIEVSGTGRLPVLCAVSFGAVVTTVVVVQAITKAFGLW